MERSAYYKFITTLVPWQFLNISMTITLET